MSSLIRVDLGGSRDQASDTTRWGMVRSHRRDAVFLCNPASSGSAARERVSRPNCDQLVPNRDPSVPFSFLAAAPPVDVVPCCQGPDVAAGTLADVPAFDDDLRLAHVLADAVEGTTMGRFRATDLVDPDAFTALPLVTKDIVR